ncbi:cytochrome P450 [Actinokineospora auranticolor]|uniref:Pentalenene oxygenase n=1 Tax=Actinokineospora auranticolor TaxID=155976 RepID=A0A2S6GTH0_9PSEU|nr:cytochrome P450 [Actinokineospora auranticolor]PPK68504.1 pentalenene oxygenase [Actinokineospora auranticolor]
MTDIPLAPGALALVGHAVPLMRDPLAFLRSLTRYDDVVGVRLGPVRAVVVTGGDTADRVLRDDHLFDKGGPFWDRVREFAGNGLSSCPHAAHRRQRRVVRPAFHADRLPGYAAAMLAQAQAVTAPWRDGDTIDVVEDMVDITARTVAVTMLAEGLPAAETEQALGDVTTLMSGLYRRMMRPGFVNDLPTPGNRAYHRAVARLRGALGRVVVDRRAAPADHGDLLSALLATYDMPDDAELVDQLVTFFIAGAETSAGCLAWTLHYLAERPDLQDQVRAEAARILVDRTAPTHATVTGRVIAESLRIRPPVWMVTRVATADTELAGHKIPAGTAVVVSPYLLHHREDVFPRADHFDPDRWLDGEPHRTAYLPFGSGARTCVGTRFANTELAIVLATVLNHWRVDPPHPDAVVRAVPAATLRPRDLRLRLTARPTIPDPRAVRQSETNRPQPA